MNEARHVEVFERYVRKVAGIYPILPMVTHALFAEAQIKVYDDASMLESLEGRDV